MKCPCPTERQPSSGLPQLSWHGQRISLRIHHHDWVLFVQLSSGPKRPPHPAVPMRDGPEVSTLVPAWVIAAVYPSSVSPAFRLRFGSIRAHWLMVPVALPGHRATEAALITALVPQQLLYVDWNSVRLSPSPSHQRAGPPVPAWHCGRAPPSRAPFSPAGPQLQSAHLNRTGAYRLCCVSRLPCEQVLSTPPLM